MTSAAIAGLGITELGKVYGRSAPSLAAEAVRLAVADAGLPLSAVDGLLISSGTKQDVGIQLANVLSTGPLGVLSTMNAYGATAGVMVATAAQAILAGAATTVACVFADAPLRPKE
ncbi:MAG TPA: thiolase family protein, partial [Sporichthya sp.]|nr:thiolase family protein [Sporichthya sp.]